MMAGLHCQDEDESRYFLWDYISFSADKHSFSSNTIAFEKSPDIAAFTCILTGLCRAMSVIRPSWWVLQFDKPRARIFPSSTRDSNSYKQQTQSLSPPEISAPDKDYNKTNELLPWNMPLCFKHGTSSGPVLSYCGMLYTQRVISQNWRKSEPYKNPAVTDIRIFVGFSMLI